MLIDRRELDKALAEVMDPELNRSLVELNMIRDVEIDGGRVTVTVALTTGGCPLKGQIGQSIRDRLSKVDGVREVQVKMTEMTAQERRAMLGKSFNTGPIFGPDSKVKVIGVASGKGGVGKSTVSTNLAVSLARKGFKVGLIDADIYGFSIPRMLGLTGRPTILDQRIVPMVAYGVKVISMGSFVGEDEPVIWRGPLLRKVLSQFLTDVLWDELDYLIIDLPPGTGDVALDVAQLIPNSSLVIVTTPQSVVSRVASRAAHMASKANQRIIGVVENMSYFVCPNCGERHSVFGEGGGRKLAEELDVPLLGQIPLAPAVREAGDVGAPAALEDDSPVGEAFRQIADRLVEARQELEVR